MASPRIVARLAGAFYVVSVAAALVGETALRGAVADVVGDIAIACFVVVALCLFALFRPGHQGLALLATALNLAGLTFEALRLHPGGVNAALVLHGAFCIATGLLTFRSTFVPRVLGVLLAIGGVAWLTNVSPRLAGQLAPYNVGVGFLGVGSFMVWLLVKGVDEARWRQQVAAAT